MSAPGPPNSWRDTLREVDKGLRQSTETVDRLLREVVARAVATVGSAEGSILVPDGSQSLRFLVAHSPAAAKLAGLPVPIAGSIAGYVFGTGQMMAVGDLTEEQTPQFYAEIDRQVGVATRTYLAVPLLFGNRVGGVATYVNRPGQPPYRPFQQQEMEQARGFAALEAVLLRHLERSRQLAQLAAQDLAVAVSALAPDALDTSSSSLDTASSIDPLLRALREVQDLPDEDQTLCAQFIELLARRQLRDVP